MLDANAFLMAMRLRKQVYVSELDKKNLSSNHLTANMNSSEEFFWNLHNSDPESWKKQATVNNEETQVEARLYSKQVEVFAANCHKTITYYKNTTAEDVLEILK